jgi:hypothetical protein
MRDERALLLSYFILILGRIIDSTTIQMRKNSMKILIFLRTLLNNNRKYKKSEGRKLRNWSINIIGRNLCLKRIFALFFFVIFSINFLTLFAEKAIKAAEKRNFSSFSRVKTIFHSS